MTNPLCPNGTGVKIETMDGLLDLADVSWQLVNSSGRICGLTVGATGPDDVTATPSQALSQFADTKTEATQMARDGYTCRPREHHAACDEYMAQRAAAKGA